MKLRPSIVLILVLSLGLLMVAVQFKRYREVVFDVELATDRLLQTAREAQEMIDLTSQRPHVALDQKPAEDVIALVNAVLSDANLKQESLSGLAPEAEQAMTGHMQDGSLDYRRQVMRIMLTDLTLPELGIFLHHWKAQAGLWTATHLELTARGEQQRSRNHNDSTSSRYDITLQISAIYVASA